jgi:hypothetical protein
MLKPTAWANLTAVLAVQPLQSFGREKIQDSCANALLADDCGGRWPIAERAGIFRPAVPGVGNLPMLAETGPDDRKRFSSMRAIAASLSERL